MKRALALLLLIACADPATEVIVVVGTDLRVPEELDEVHISVQRAERDPIERSTMVGTDDFPVTLGLVHDGGPLGPVVVTVSGRLGGREVVERRARFDFVPRRTLTLRMDLLQDCIGQACGEDRTCTERGCQSIDISPDQLKPWGETDGGACAMETCNGADDDCDGNVDEDWDFFRDAENCGGCGVICPSSAPAASSGACIAGRCELECEPLVGDCDEIPTNGCETELRSETDCGACGRSCERFEASTSCETGTCTLVTCNPGHRDCDLNPDNGCESELRDNANCGGCGIPCDLLNAVASCGTGACLLSSCDPGFDNCDGRTENGCEADVRADVFHCGGCGRRCEGERPNAANVCVDGDCDVECYPGWADCDGIAENGCETDLSDPSTCGNCGTRCTGIDFLCSGTATTGYRCIPPPCMDPPTRCGAICVDVETNERHCGGCDVACPGGDNAAPICQGAACGLRCDPGFGDCDGDPANGCEQPLNDPANCGVCDNACNLMGGDAVCIGGACIISTCDPGFEDCNLDPDDGCETSTKSLTDCGGCGNICERDNATPTCDGGSCTIDVCDDGWGDCDGLNANGCETPLAACETCAGICVLDNASGSCVSEACRIDACDPGWDDCDGVVSNGCETSLRALSDCGGCGMSCTLENATATCATGSCAVDACSPGFDDCDGLASNGCEDPLDGAANCGVCGNVCDPGEACIDGSCRDENDLFAVSGGDLHTCAVAVGGQAYCWGENFSGQVGDGSWTDRDVPTPVSGLTDAVKIAAGRAVSCAIREAGRVVCWGSDFYGQLGNGGGMGGASNEPVNTSITDGVEIAAGDDFACAVRSTGRVECWGNNDHGQLGDGTTANRTSPVEVAGLSNAVTVAVGHEHACALRGDGQVLCWGSNDAGELGVGSTDPSRTPRPVSGIVNAVDVVAANFFTCALLDTGQVRCWGLNDDGQLGDGTNLRRLLPVAVSDIDDALIIDAGEYHVCVAEVAQVRCWGRNDDGQLGDGTRTDRDTPVTVSGVPDTCSLGGGREHTCAVLDDGRAFCWGEGRNGQLGTGSRSDELMPTLVE